MGNPFNAYVENVPICGWRTYPPNYPQEKRITSAESFAVGERKF
jgi:hypothetical protein